MEQNIFINFFHLTAKFKINCFTFYVSNYKTWDFHATFEALLKHSGLLIFKQFYSFVQHISMAMTRSLPVKKLFLKKQEKNKNNNTWIILYSFGNCN